MCRAAYCCAREQKNESDRYEREEEEEEVSRKE
jgi:hypothetical protein